MFSGLTRREQQVLVFLILAIAAGLAYQQYKGGWRREPLTLHRASANSTPVAATAAANPMPRGRPERRTAATTATAAVAGPLDINQATAEQLETLPGIGPVRAAAIVRYRETHGPFRQLADLKRVSGIGDKTLEAVKPFLKPPDGPTTSSAAANSGTTQTGWAAKPQPAPPPPDVPPPVNINTATIEELDMLDGIGPALARRIVEYRQQHGPFRTAADIVKVQGIGPSVFQKKRNRLTVGPPRR